MDNIPYYESKLWSEVGTVQRGLSEDGPCLRLLMLVRAGIYLSPPEIVFMSSQTLDHIYALKDTSTRYMSQAGLCSSLTSLPSMP